MWWEQKEKDIPERGNGMFKGISIKDCVQCLRNNYSKI